MSSLFGCLTLDVSVIDITVARPDYQVNERRLACPECEVQWIVAERILLNHLSLELGFKLGVDLL